MGLKGCRADCEEHLKATHLMLGWGGKGLKDAESSNASNCNCTPLRDQQKAMACAHTLVQVVRVLHWQKMK